MADLKCNVCETIFSGEDALHEIKEHLMGCAVTKVEKTDDNLLVLLKEEFPDMQNIEYKPTDEYDDFDDPDYLVVTRKDGSTYEVIYRHSEAFRTRAEDMYTIASRNIHLVESSIAAIIHLVTEKVATSDIRFSGMRKNTGYLGNGYLFTFSIGEKKETLTYYKNSGTVETFAGRVISCYQNEVSGMLTKFNNDYTIDGICINQWLLQRVGKNITLKEA